MEFDKIRKYCSNKKYCTDRQPQNKILYELFWLKKNCRKKFLFINIFNVIIDREDKNKGFCYKFIKPFGHAEVSSINTPYNKNDRPKIKSFLRR